MRRPSAMGGGATYSVPVLRRTPGVPSPSPQPPSSPPLGARKGEGAASPSPWPPASPTRGAEGGTWGGWRESMVARARNGCVLGARASGPHLDGWNRGALVAAPVLRRTPGAPSPSPQPPSAPPLGRGRGRALPPLPPGPFTASLVAWRARSRTGRGRFPTCPLGGWTRGHMRGVGVAPSPSPWPPASPPLGARKGEGAAFPSPSPLHRFARRSACSFPPLPYTDDLIDERSVAWGDR
jgi:hypothetical protein